MKKCYSDHNEDIRTKGDCDYCGSSEKIVFSNKKQFLKDCGVEE